MQKDEGGVRGKVNNSNNLFNSKTEPIPEVRREIEIIPVENNGDSFLYFHDNFGYATPNFALDSKAATILSLLDGHKSIQDLSPYLGEGVSSDQLLKYIQYLDENRLLHSSHFKEYSRRIEQKYEESDVHKSITAGFSYPADPKELKKILDESFSKSAGNPENKQKLIKGLYAPHIDPRVGMGSYVKAFSAVKDIQPKRVVILATSHYASLHRDIYQNKPFIISDKDFKLPLGTIKSDKEAIDNLFSTRHNTGITKKDRAHRVEHSIELHLLFLSYLWDHDYQIVPILVNGLDDLLYMRDGHRARQVEAFGKLINEQFGKDEDTFFLISGDLAHIGKKFGDPQPADNLFNEVRNFDKMFLQYGEQGAADKLLNLINEKYDPYRICGYPPLYTFLKSIPDLTGKVLHYDLWDEQERKSAVTFGSILYWMEN